MIVFFREVSQPFIRELDQGPQGKSLKAGRCQKQAMAFQKAVRETGCEIEQLPSCSDSLASVFLIDDVLLLPEVAVVSGEKHSGISLKSDAQSLARHRPVQRVNEPGFFSIVDIVPMNNTIYIGLSNSTNSDGVSGLQEIVAPFGYEVKIVGLGSDVGLRSACSFIPPCFVLLNPEWIEASVFEGLIPILVAEAEPAGAATVSLRGTTLVSASFPKTEKLLQAEGITTRQVDISELEKAGCSLPRLCVVKESRVGKSTFAGRGAALKVVEIPQVPSLGHAAQAIIHGGCAYVSAQLPFDPTVPTVPKMSLEEQVEQVLHNVALVLHAAGSSLADVLHATVHLADPKDIERIEATYARMFERHRPVRSVISNQALPVGVLIEIEVVAAVSKRRHI